MLCANWLKTLCCSLFACYRHLQWVRRFFNDCDALGGILSAFYRLFGSRERRILILGLDGAGKTTILYKLQVGEVVTTIPSMFTVAP